MALKTAANNSNAQGFKFENKGDKLEGYYLETKEEVINGSPVKKHYFKTSEGMKSVLGQHDLTRKLIDNNCAGCWVEVEFDGVQKLKGGKTLKLYTVQYNDEDRYDGSAVGLEEDVDETDIDADDVPMDQVTPTRNSAPKGQTASPNAALQARTEALLSKGRNKNAS